MQQTGFSVHYDLGLCGLVADPAAAVIEAVQAWVMEAKGAMQAARALKQ